ncbi:MAG: response regulator [Acidobacteriaceae bacterium]
MIEIGKRGRVLVIDDQEPTRYIFRRILNHAGYNVEEADTGSDGLRMAMSLPDLIIADVNLPDMLGYEVCRRLRSNPSTVNIPVLQISASFISDESKVQALQGGADSYLTQPVEPTVLLAQVSALLRLRKAEALSSLSARQWQITFDALSDGLALVDPKGLVLRVNRTFRDLLGFVPTEVEGRPISCVFESRFEASFDELSSKEAEQGSLELPSNGRWFRVRFDKIRTDAENETGSVLLVTDITDHKKLQETLKLSERLAATGRLAHIIAHEVNNPLEAMSNLLYLALQSTSPQQESYRYIEQASAELMRISLITKQVLAYHRESTKPILTPSDELLDGAVAMFRAQSQIAGVELISRIRCTRQLKVHPGEIRQVFSNLIANGIDAIGTGGGKLRVTCFETTDQRTQRKGVRFLFSDSGSGIPAEVFPKIFDAFYTTKDARGSGIGLWLSAEVIGKHKGKISVRSRTQGPYRGTLFDVFLPSPL